MSAECTVQRRPPHPLAPGEAARILEACRSTWAGVRNRALIALLWRGGLRAAEALSVQLDDTYPTVLPSGERVRVVRVARPKGYARGAAPREVGLDPQATAVLEAWLERRGGAPGPLFWTRHGGRLSDRYVRRMVASMASRAGLRRRVHPHCLRHTFARELYDESVGMREIQLALGHRRLDTTATYLESIGATEVVAATAMRSW